MYRSRFFYGITVLVGAMLLSAFWVVPFLANHAYMTDMKYHGRPDGPTDSYWDMFFPWTTFLDIVVTGFALFGFIASVVRRHLVGAWLGICCLALTAFVFLAKNSLQVIGLLWNPRLLPSLHLFRRSRLQGGEFPRKLMGREGKNGAPESSDRWGDDGNVRLSREQREASLNCKQLPCTRDMSLGTNTHHFARSQCLHRAANPCARLFR